MAVTGSSSEFRSGLERVEMIVISALCEQGSG